MSRFDDVRSLSTGRSGLVRAARDGARGGAPVVLKREPPDAPGEAEREYRVLSEVRHPALARAIDLVVDGGRPTVVLERVPGESLEVRVRRVGPLDAEAGAAVAVAVLSALDRLHAAGFLHLDVKPANVVVRGEGRRLRAVLVDAGLALDRVAASRSGRAGGTEAFAAPEVRAGGAVDARADLFSLGVTLRETIDPREAARLAPLVDRLTAERVEARPPDAGEALATPVLARAHEAWRRATVVPLPWIARPPGEARLLERVDRTGIVELLGPTGSGRSALLERLHRTARLDGRAAYLVRATGGAEFAARLAAALDVPPLVRPKSASYAVPGASSGEGESAAFERTLRVLRAVPPHALVLVDDADRLERDALAALRSVAFGRDAASGGFLLASARPLELGGASIPLAPVTAGDLAAALTRLTAARLDPGLVRRVAEKLCEGRRGSARGIAEALASAMRRAPSAVSALRAIDRGAVPAGPRLGPSVLRDLEPLPRRLVRALAITGGPVSDAALAAVGGEPEETWAALAALRERGIVLRAADGTRELHPRLAAALRRSRGDSEEVREVAARLAEAVASPERELCRFVAAPSPETDRELAGVLDVMREHGSPRKALVCARRAAEEAPAQARRTGIVAARAWIDRGRLDEAEQAIEWLGRGVGEHGDVAALLRLAQAELSLARGDLKDAAAQAARAASTAAAASDEPTRCRARNLEGVALYRAGAYGDVLRLTAAPNPSEGSIERALRSNLAGIACLRLGRLDDAAAALGEALSSFRDAGADSGVAMVRNNLALVESRRGRPARALRHLLVLRRAAAKDEATVRQALASNNAALILRDAGRLERARGLLDEAVRLRRAVGERYGLAASLSNRATVLAELGEASEALRDVDESIAAFAAAGAPAKELVARKNRARVLAALGDDEAFARAAAEAKGRAAELGAPIERGDVLRAEALVLSRRGDTSGAAALLREAVAAYVEAGDATRETEALVESALLRRGGPAEDDDDDDARARILDLRDRLAREASRERRAMIALALASLSPPDADAWVVEAFTRLERSARPRWRLLAAASAASVAARHDRPVALDRALAVGREALDRLERGAPGFIDPFAAESVRRLAAARGDEALAALSGPALRRDARAPDADVHAVLDLYRRLAETRDVEPMFDAILDAARTLSGASRALLLVREGDEDEAVVLRARDDGALPLEEPDEQYSRAVLETVLGSGRPVVLGDAALDPRWSGHLSVRRLRLRSVACLPLRVGGRTLGALYVDQAGRSRAFDPDRLGLLERFADQASLALDRVRNEERIRALNQELERRLARVERALGAERRRGGVAGALRPVMRIAGSHPTIARVRTEIERAAVTDLPVLLTGETGTGKGLAARCLHDASPRSSGPFVVLFGATVPESLFEAEVFGAIEGAYTGATERSGIAGEADGGTLFLDEVDTLSPAAQAKLLRFLERFEIRPVGGRPRRVDVRIVAAASEDLTARLESGAFRSDLYWRLKGIRVALPPLRERGEDVLELAELFLAEAGAGGRPLRPAARQRLLAHPWRGNVRELQNEMVRLATRGGGPIGAADLAPSLRGVEEESQAAEAIDERGARELRRKTEVDLVRRALRQTGGNRTRAARLLGMSRYGFLKKLHRLGLQE